MLDPEYCQGHDAPRSGFLPGVALVTLLGIGLQKGCEEMVDTSPQNPSAFETVPAPLADVATETCRSTETVLRTPGSMNPESCEGSWRVEAPRTSVGEEASASSVGH